MLLVALRRRGFAWVAIARAVDLPLAGGRKRSRAAMRCAPPRRSFATRCPEAETLIWRRRPPMPGRMTDCDALHNA